MPGQGRRAVLVIFTAAVILLAFAESPARGETLGPTWTSTTGYLNGIGLQSCLTNADYNYIYCIGGYQGGTYTSATNYAQTTATGLGGWTSTTAYPTNIELQSCVTSGGYIYCIGGFDGIHYSNATYYVKPALAGGLGASWTASKAYPISVASQSCVASSGYVYCIGGTNATSGKNDVYYGQFSSSGGIGNWTRTTSYPVTVSSQSCAVASGYVYCVGGYANKAYANSAYFAPLTSAGVGAWSPTTSYPTNIEEQSCFTYSSYVYCVGGYYNFSMVNGVYYDSISPVAIPTVTSTTTSTTSVPTTITNTVTFTPTQTITSTTTSTTTATSLSLVTISRTTVVTTTTTTPSISSTTTTVTSKVTTTVFGSGTAPATTVTVTQNQSQTQAGSTPSTMEIGFAAAGLVFAAAGLVLGMVLALAVTRLKGPGRGGKQSETPKESDSADGEDDEDTP